MNHALKLEVLQKADRRRSGISDEKGPEYAGQADAYKDDDQDVLANFKRVAAKVADNPVRVLSIYMGKHMDSIDTFVREFCAAENDAVRVSLVNRGEGLVSRLDDARNYLDLFECLLWDLGYHPDEPVGPAVDAE